MTSTPFKGATPGSVHPVLQPQDGFGSTDFSEGVGTPQVISDPETTDKKLLFTGWSATDGTARSMFVADIDSALNISNPTQILTPGDLGVNTLNAGYGFYDLANDEWLITATPNSSTGLYIVRFSRDFSTINGSQGYSIDTKDSGASIFTGLNDNLLLSVANASSGNIEVIQIQNDISARPLSDTFSQKTTLIRDTEIRGPDVHHTAVYNGKIATLCEFKAAGPSGGSNWNLRPTFGGEVGDLGVQRTIVSDQSLYSHAGASNGAHMGHPHYSTELDRPLLFFAWFRNFPDSIRHEI